MGGYNYVGNDTLSRTLVDNVDLRWEFFVRPTELFSISAFYKNFENPIEATFIPLSQNPLLTWRNVSEAMIYGLELEARKNLGFISESLSPFSVGANVTLVQSRISISEAELQRKRRFNPELDAGRQMAGQSPYIINTNVAYVSKNTEMNLVFNVQGTRLSIVSPDATPDVYEKPVPGLNFNVSRKISERWKAKFSASNILNPEVKFVHEFKGEEYIFQQYRRGRDFSVGVSYALF